MPRPYQTKREMVDDLIMLYGQVSGAADAGLGLSAAAMLERLGHILGRAHITPPGHEANVARAREAADRAARPREASGGNVVPLPRERAARGLRNVAGT